MEDADLLDAGLIFGAGFAPFRGGPIHYLKSVDAAALYTKISAIRKASATQSAPDPGWQSLIRV